MNAKVLMHVREHSTGRVIVTPVDFAGLSVDANDLPAAMRLATERVSAQLRNMSGSVRARHAEPVDAELDSIVVELPKPKGAKPVRVTVALVVTLRETNAGTIYIVSAPEVPHIHMAARERDEAVRRAEKGIRESFENWGISDVLSCDDPGGGTLELVEVPFPQPSEDNDTDDGFSLRSSADDLTEQAAAGRLSRLDGRDTIVERVLAALCAETRASVMLVGRQDVGKTALIDELASRLAAGEVPAALEGRPLWRVTANQLIAGARYTGMWQDRARALITHGRTGTIFAMGDPNGILDAGRWSGSDNNLGRVLQTYVENGELSLICECSEELYAAAHVVEPSFIDAFQRIDMPEPPEDEAREIVALAAQRLEARHGVAIEPGASTAAFDLGRRFEPYRALPGKAVRLLEETIQQATAADEPAAAIGHDDVVAAFATRSGMPRMLLTDEITLDRAEVRGFLEQRVLGQPEAVEQVVDLVTVFKAALQDPNKPLATLFFVGPTGVGKTELSKALAEFLFGSRERLIRFDMGEYAGGDAVAKLIGSGWSHDRKGGELTTRVREQPFCVVLLDEIEKAHPDVYDALLSALGEGRLTDARGQTADFRNAIVIMTSNLGASRRESSVVGFAGDGDTGEEDERVRRHFAGQAERFFRPEFFNRIDRLVTFDALDRDTIRSIARRHLGSLLMREGIARRRLLVEIDDAVVDHLAQIGFHPQYGARPLLRAIEQAVIQPLARVIVAERPEPGALIRFTAVDGEVRATLHAVEIKRTPPARRTREVAPRDAGFARAAAEVDRLAERAEADAAGPEATELAGELSRLVDLANAPSFWDDPDGARRELGRLYQLQQLAERRTAIATRIEGLAAMAQRVRQARDRRRLGELRDAVAEIEDDVELLRLETVATAHSGVEDDADLRVTPIGPDAEPWAETLLGMYGAWADRTGRIAGPLDGEPAALRIAGAATLALLRHETGLHRRRLPNGTTLLARVTVTPAGEPAEPAREEDAATVVRGYSEGRHVFVKDTRTGQKTSDVDGVLERGLIDDFLVAEVRRGAGERDVNPGDEALGSPQSTRRP